MQAAGAGDVERERQTSASLKNWGEPPREAVQTMARNAVLDCGWGRLLFGQTFAAPEEVARLLEQEASGERDVAFYVREPHVVLAHAPQSLFLDPSHSFRLDLTQFDAEPTCPTGITLRPARAADEKNINSLYRARGMVPVRENFCAETEGEETVTILVLEQGGSAAGMVGVVLGVDHKAAIDDPDNGSSLWALAVDPQADRPGLGRTLVTALACHFRDRGRAHMDLSVMHDNAEAIALYESLGFVRIPVYCVKKKNPINESLFIGPDPEERLNIYARIVVDEARRRGIVVEVEDAEAGLFRLTLGGRSIACRESLSDMTSAVAMSRCDDKALTRRLLAAAGIAVPAQIAIAGKDTESVRAFLERHRRVVVKPARGEQGRGVTVDLRTSEDVAKALRRARSLCETVIVEEYREGQDLRVIVIDGAVVAAAVRRPPTVRGDGRQSIRALISKLDRRRAAATGGESRIPLDGETERTVRSAGYAMSDVLPAGDALSVRKTANLHTGGTIHDVTGSLHHALAEAAIRGARALDIPVVGFDFIVRDPAQPDYVAIEANERPGLANHEPQPTAQRFIDFLFPQTKAI